MSRRNNSKPELGLAISKVLVPTDGSKNAIRALNLAILLAKKFDAELTILNVIPSPRTVVDTAVGWIPTSTAAYYDEQENISKRLLDEELSLCKTHGVKKVRSEIVRASKSIVGEIIDLATKRKIELIVIGTRGLGGFRKLIQGSVSSGVVTHARCNVLVVR